VASGPAKCCHFSDKEVLLNFKILKYISNLFQPLRHWWTIGETKLGSAPPPSKQITSPAVNSLEYPMFKGEEKANQLVAKPINAHTSNWPPYNLLHGPPLLCVAGYAGGLSYY
jgi:hypothetical protein